MITHTTVPTIEEVIGLYSKEIEIQSKQTARMLHLQETDIPDLKQSGWLAILKAREKYTPAKGCSFEEYIKKRIHYAMLNEANRMILAHNKRWYQQWSLQRKLELAQKRGISFRKFAEQEGMSPDKCRRIIDTKHQPLSLDVIIAGEGIALRDAIRDSFSWDAVNTKIDLKEWMENLDPEEKTMLNLHYFGRMTLKDTAEHMDISQSKASMIKQRINDAVMQYLTGEKKPTAATTEHAIKRYDPYVQTVSEDLRRRYQLSKYDKQRVVTAGVTEAARIINILGIRAERRQRYIENKMYEKMEKEAIILADERKDRLWY